METTNKHDEFRVTLRFYGDDLKPDEMTRLLGCAPTNAERTGEIVTTSRGTTRTVRRGNWRLGAETSEAEIEDQVVELLARLTDDLAVWQALTARFEADVFCGVFPA